MTPAALLPHRVVSPQEMDAWPLDRPDEGQGTWAARTWSATREMPFNFNVWPARIVLRVEGPAEVVEACAFWRRSRLSARLRGLKLLSAASARLVADAELLHFDAERVVIRFRPEDGPGLYHLYYGSHGEPRFEPSQAWLRTARAAGSPPQATAEGVEARCALDSFHPMETVALADEADALLARHPGAGYLVFPEDRDRPIRLRQEIPAHWAIEGPRTEIVLRADRDEYRVFQLGVWACRRALSDLKVRAGDLHRADAAAAICGERIRCLTLESRAPHLYMGRPTGPFPLPAGRVKALWFGIDLPADQAPGRYEGTVRVEPPGEEPAEVRLVVHVSDRAVERRGDHDLHRLSRLRWLESDAGLDGRIHPPFAPLRTDRAARTVRTWGHEFRLAAGGLPATISAAGEDVLAEPVRLEGLLDGRPLRWRTRGCAFDEVADEHVTWHAAAGCGPLRLRVAGRLEFDGCAVLDMALSAARETGCGDLTLRLAWRKAHALLGAGLGYRGLRDGDRAVPLSDGALSWHPTVWLGSVRAGLGWLTESTQPWAEGDRPDALTVADEGGCVALRANFGDQTVGPERLWRLRFALRPTPVRPPDPRHWQFRYAHFGGGFQPGDCDTPQSFLKDGCRRLDEMARIGVRRLNLHDWWGPAFNYPWQWDGPDNLSRLTCEAHRRGLRVKVYNSGREMSALAPEFWPLLDEAQRAPQTDALDPGMKGARYYDAWHENHTPDSCTQGWPRLSPGHGNEHSVVVGNAHRCGSFYLESLRYMTECFGTDGAYWDGADYPYETCNMQAGFGWTDARGRLRPVVPYLAMREMARRAWAIFRSARPEAAIDAHHGATGLESPMADHMLCLPFIDSVWHGEGFDYDRYDRWAWLVEIAGVPFGVPSELLGGEEFLGLAMLFGIWPRAAWCAGTQLQEKLWAALDRFRIHEAHVHGWWQEPAVAALDRPEVLATVFCHPERGVLLVAAGWHRPAPHWMECVLKVGVQLDRAALGLPQGPLPAVDVMTDEELDAARPIPLPDARRGRLLWIRPHG